MDIKNEIVKGLSRIGADVKEDLGVMHIDGSNAGIINGDTWENVSRYVEAINEIGYKATVSNFTISYL